MWLDTKTNWLTDRQSQCDFDFDTHSRLEKTLFLLGSAPKLYKEYPRVVVSPVQSSPVVVQLGVEGLAVECLPADNGNGRISIAKIRYRETSSEDIAEE
jgi:hypothetical protein